MTEEVLMLTPSQPSPQHSHPDYVIVVREARKRKPSVCSLGQKSPWDNSLINLFEDKLEEIGLNLRRVRSIEYKDLWYILVYVPRDVLIARAELNRTSVPLKEVLVRDMMLATQSAPTPDRSRLSTIWGFVKEWFRPTLESGYMKFEYNRKYDALFTSEPDKDPFVMFTRVRSNLVHDMIKDVDLKDELEARGYLPERTRYEYRGLEWMKRQGHIVKSFVPHCNHDRERCEGIRKGKATWIQSVSSIREYLGEKVGFSFAWRAAWLSCGLTIPSILGKRKVIII